MCSYLHDTVTRGGVTCGPSALPLHQTGTRHWVSADRRSVPDPTSGTTPGRANVPLAARRRALELFTANLAPLGIRLITQGSTDKGTPPASPSISALTTPAHRRLAPASRACGSIWPRATDCPIEVLPPPSLGKYWT